MSLSTDRELKGGTVLPFLLVTLIWGSTWIVIRDQLAVVPPSWSVCYRFIIAAVGMAVVTRLSGASFAIGWRGLAFAAMLGFAQFCLNFNFVYRAEAHITSGLVALVFALLMVPNSLLAWLFFGERVSRFFIAGSFVAIAGIALLFVHEYRASPANASAVLAGVGFTLCALMSASSANVMQAAPVARALPMTAVLSWAMAIGAAVDAVWAWVTTGPPLVELRLGYWLGTLYLGLAGSVVTFPLYFRLIQRMGAGRAAYTSMLIPVIAMAISTLVEGYRWTDLSIAGAVLTMAGMVIALRARQTN
ncbi:DMT family transporter [Sphingobium sp. CR28]|uniref:DMT family transporter n=1 Tax=Sphingobium sp. CR28 TaxID=3400272 RepID=UPI003FEEE653